MCQDITDSINSISSLHGLPVCACWQDWRVAFSFHSNDLYSVTAYVLLCACNCPVDATVAAGMLGTAAMTITSPAPDAAAAQQSAAASDPNNQQLNPAGSSSSSLADADACDAAAGSSSSCCPARGAAAARDPTINSGCATPASVRQQQQIAGLVPPRQVGCRFCTGHKCHLQISHKAPLETPCM
jgi:hypothetical protein